MARPKGSKNVKDVQTVDVPRCPYCTSTAGKVLGTNTLEYEGTDSVTGLQFNRVVRRRTLCLDCEQQRIDRSLEYVPPDAPKVPDSPPDDDEVVFAEPETELLPEKAN